MKKTLYLFCTLILFLSLTSCTKDNDALPEYSREPPPPESLIWFTLETMAEGYIYEPPEYPLPPEGVIVPLILTTEYVRYSRTVREINVTIKNPTEWTAFYSRGFVLERQNGEEWECVPYGGENVGFFNMLSEVDLSKSERVRKFDIAQNFELPLRAGIYRIGVTCRNEDGEFVVVHQTNEFIVK